MCSRVNLFDTNIRKFDAKTKYTFFPQNTQIVCKSLGKTNFFNKIIVLEVELLLKTKSIKS